MSIITVSQQQLLQSSFAPTASLDFIDVSANPNQRTDILTGQKITEGLLLKVNLSFDRKLNSLINSIKTAKEPFIKSLLNSFKFKIIICPTEDKATRLSQPVDFFPRAAQYFSIFLDEQTRERNFISNADRVLDTKVFTIKDFIYDPASDVYRVELWIFTDRNAENIKYLSILHAFYIDPIKVSENYSLSAPIDLLTKNFFSNEISNLKIINDKKYENLEKTVEMNYIEQALKEVRIQGFTRPTKKPYFSNLFANFSEFEKIYSGKKISSTVLKYSFFFDRDRYVIENCAFPEIAKEFAEEEKTRFLNNSVKSIQVYRKRIDIKNQPEEIIINRFANSTENLDFKNNDLGQIIVDKLTSLNDIYFFSGIDTLNKEKTETSAVKKITTGTYQYKILAVFQDKIYIILQDLLKNLQNDNKVLLQYRLQAKIPETYQRTIVNGRAIDDPHVVDNVFLDGNYNPTTGKINTRLLRSFSSSLDFAIENYVKIWLVLSNLGVSQEQKNKNKNISSAIRRALKFAVKPGTGTLDNLNKFINAHTKAFQILKDIYNSKSNVPFDTITFPGTNVLRLEETFNLQIKANIAEHFGFKFLNENNLTHPYGIPQINFNTISTLTSSVNLNSIYFVKDKKPEEVSIEEIKNVTTASANDLDNRILKNIEATKTKTPVNNIKTVIHSLKVDAVNLAKSNNSGKSFVNNKALSKQLKKEDEAKIDNPVFVSLINTYQTVVFASDPYKKLTKDSSMLIKYYSFNRDAASGDLNLKDITLNIFTADQPSGKYFCILETAPNFPRDYVEAPIFDKYFIINKQ